jgi:hypothetical protein
MSQNPKQKLYCYVDETGQDSASDVFILVAIVTDDDQDKLRQAIIEIEEEAGIVNRKWYSSRLERRTHYLNLVLRNKIADGNIFFGVFKKPLPFFLPLVAVLEKAIKIKAESNYTARILVDGIDHQKASELTLALRRQGISLRMARGKQDESEPLIRLADMWAGCIRSGLLELPKERDVKEIFDQAIRIHHIQKLDL